MPDHEQRYRYKLIYEFTDLYNRVQLDWIAESLLNPVHDGVCRWKVRESFQQSVQIDFGWQPDLFNERTRKKHAAGAPRRRLGYEELLWSHGRAGHIGPPKAWIRQTFEKDQEAPRCVLKHLAG